MKKLLRGIVFACLGLAAPANAADVTFSLTGNSGTSGTDGNGRFYTGTNGATVINVRVSGWSLDGSTIRDSFLGAYGNGVGVTSGDDDGGADNQHAIDNQDRRDFLLLQFDQAVQLVSGNFAVYSLVGNTRDTDALIAWGTSTYDWRSQLPFNEQNAAALAALFNGAVTSLGNGSGGTRNLGTGSATGNLWLVGADFDNADGVIDGFKFGGLVGRNVVTSAVPEPGTWATMLIGFGAVGAAMRRRPRRTLALA